MNVPLLLQGWWAAEYLVTTIPDERLRIGRRAVALEARHPGVAHFALLTAWNPQGVALDPRANVAAERALDKALQAANIPFTPALNRAAGGGWEEPSRLLLDAGDARLDVLACRFGQAGALAWCRGRAVRLRLYRPDWREAASRARVDTRFIDWVACAPP